MSVYVDDGRYLYGRMRMCHMTADSTEELIEMASAIGVSLRHIQYPGRWNEHLDICVSKRSEAVRLGAVERSVRDTVVALAQKRENHDG